MTSRKTIVLPVALLVASCAYGADKKTDGRTYAQAVTGEVPAQPAQPTQPAAARQGWGAWLVGLVRWGSKAPAASSAQSDSLTPAELAKAVDVARATATSQTTWQQARIDARAKETGRPTTDNRPLGAEYRDPNAVNDPQ